MIRSAEWPGELETDVAREREVHGEGRGEVTDWAQRVGLRDRTAVRPLEWRRSESERNGEERSPRTLSNLQNGMEC